MVKIGDIVTVDGCRNTSNSVDITELFEASVLAVGPTRYGKTPVALRIGMGFARQIYKGARRGTAGPSVMNVNQYRMVYGDEDRIGQHSDIIIYMDVLKVISTTSVIQHEIKEQEQRPSVQNQNIKSDTLLCLLS